MKRFFSDILFLISLTLSVALIMSYFLSFLSPERIGIFVFLQFAFPYLWIVSLVSGIVYIVMRQWRSTLLFVIALVLTWNGFASVVNLDYFSSHREGGLKVMTFNVRAMNVFDIGKSAKLEDFARFISEESPDILCLQEMVMNDNHVLKPYDYSIKNLFKGYEYVITEQDVYGNSNVNRGQVILSRYPIKVIDVEKTNDSRHPEKICFAVEVTVGEKKFVLFNCHLESIRLSSDEIAVVNKVKKADVSDKTKADIKGTKVKMTSAFLSRAKQVEALKMYIEMIDSPVVVCGDFNDTSISYTYQVLSSLLSDAFIESGHGWGDTYNGNLPPLRIDHMMYSEGIHSDNYTIHKVDLSDHFPVSCSIFLE